MDERELAQQIEADSTRLSALAAKLDLSDDDLVEAERLRDGIQDKRAQLSALKDRKARVEALRGDAREAERFVNAGVPPVPFNHGGAQGEDTRGRVIGYAPAGSTLFQDGGDGLIEAISSGYGHISPEKFQKLRSKEYKQAFMSYLRCKGDDRRMPDAQHYVLQEGIDEQGGYLVPPDWVAALIQREPTPTEVNSQVTSWDTVRDRVVFPKVKYAGNADDDPSATIYSTGVRVSYPGEVPDDDTTIDSPEPAFGEIEVPVHTAMGALPVTNNMLEDSPFALQQFLMNAFSETVALEYDNRILRGDGIGKASGILRAPVSSATGNEPQYIPTGIAGALSADQIKALAFSVAPQYLKNARFVMSWMSGAKEIDTLKDGNGRYLWSMGTQNDGMSESILGRRLLGFGVNYSEFMPSVAANAHPIIFGDLRGYLMARRLGMTVQVLRETKAKRNQVELVIRFRFGGKVWKPWTLKTQKVAVS